MVLGKLRLLYNNNITMHHDIVLKQCLEVVDIIIN